MFAEPSRCQAGALDAFVAGLRPGPVDRGGQDALKLAFTSYVAAAGRDLQRHICGADDVVGVPGRAGDLVPSTGIQLPVGGV